MKKLLLVLTLIVAVTLSFGQSVTTHVFESNVQEELLFDSYESGFKPSGEYYGSSFLVEVSPHNLTLKQGNEVVFKETLIPANRQEFEKWTIYGFYSANKQGMTVSLLINKPTTTAETGDYGMLWVCERANGTGTGVSFILNKNLGTIVRNVTMSLGLEE